MTQIMNICLIVIAFGIVAHSANLNIIDVYRKEVFNIAVLKNRKPVITYFTSSSCSLCETVYSKLVDMAKEHSKKIYVAKVDFDKTPQLKEQFGIEKVPTTRIYVNGEITNEVLGPKWLSIKGALQELV